MRSAGVPILCIIAATALMTGCRDQIVPVRRGFPATMTEPWIENGAFEVAGHPSLQGWRLGGSRLADLVHEAPPPGTFATLKLTSSATAGIGYAYAPVLGCRNLDVLSVFAYARASGAGGGATVGIKVGLRPPRNLSDLTAVASTQDPYWSRLNVSRLLSLAPEDSVWVVLAAPPAEEGERSGLFALVVVEFTRQYGPPEIADTTKPYPFPLAPGTDNLRP